MKDSGFMRTLNGRSTNSSAHSTRHRQAATTGAIAMGLALSLLVTACGSGSTSSRTEPTTSKVVTTTSAPRTSPSKVVAPGTFAVGQATRTFTDDTRVTDAHGGQSEKPGRILKTLILYPTAGTPDKTDSAPHDRAEPLAGPWPTIVFGHGSTRPPEHYLGKLTYWASAGYVVVAPAFPLSKEGTPGGTAYGDYPNQTGDESFLIDQVTTDDAAPLHLKSLVDPKAMGVGGQSFGAITALGTVAAECCADKRIKAATTFAGAWLPYPSKDALAPWASKVPVLFFHGSDDPTLPYDGDRKFFERLGAPGGFITLVGSGHDPGYFDATKSLLDTFVSQASLAFYDDHLKGGPDSTPIIEDLVDAVGPKVATFIPS